MSISSAFVTRCGKRLSDKGFPLTAFRDAPTPQCVAYLSSLVKGVGPATPAWMGSVIPREASPCSKTVSDARIEAELGGDVHGEAVGTGKGLLALQRLPKHLIRHHRVPSGWPATPTRRIPASLDHTAFEQFERARERGIGNRHVTGHQQHLLHATRSQDAQAIAQPLCIDDPPRNDMR